ncbi:MAG TPA: hypothetical protein VFG19_13210 [Geobacteraceae bacterium]|nr:hypothetical protein [Geobacteraceae bacterium]
MVKRILAFAVMMLMLVTLQAVAGQPAGVTGTVFNKRFIPNIRPMMSYDQIVRVTGAQGAKVGESRSGSTSVSSYRWNGGRGSVLNARIAGGKLLDATIKAPNGHTYAIGRDGKVSDLGD